MIYQQWNLFLTYAITVSSDEMSIIEWNRPCFTILTTRFNLSFFPLFLSLFLDPENEIFHQPWLRFFRLDRCNHLCLGRLVNLECPGRLVDLECPERLADLGYLNKERGKNIFFASP